MVIQKEIKAILFCSWFVTIILLTKEKKETFQWYFVLFFFIVGLLYFARLFNIFGIFRRKENNVWNRNSKQDFQKLIEEDGIFIYENSKFSFSFSDKVKEYGWTDIKTLIAYKEDLNTYDEIYLRILFVDRQLFLINESTAGWYKFIKLMKENIPSVPNNWDYEITKPAFATNLTVLFDKENREDKLAIKDSYDE